MQYLSHICFHNLYHLCSHNLYHLCSTDIVCHDVIFGNKRYNMCTMLVLSIRMLVEINTRDTYGSMCYVLCHVLRKIIIAVYVICIPKCTNISIEIKVCNIPIFIRISPSHPEHVSNIEIH
jgi:hypothetical protein